MDKTRFCNLYPILLLLLIHTPVFSGQLSKIVIAHRGASGYLPEHTLAAKALAHGMGAHYIEQDVVLSKDGQPIVLHDIYLQAVTNVAEIFPERARIDNKYYAIDFDLAEIKQLKVTERSDVEKDSIVDAKRFPPHQSTFQIPTLSEEIELIQGLNHSTGKLIGLYVEVKEPAWHQQHGKDISRVVLKTLSDYGYTKSEDLVYVQCFDPSETRRMREVLKTDLKLVQLIGYKNPNSAIDYEQMILSSGLKLIAGYADGIGPSIQHIVKNIQQDGQPILSSLVQDAHKLNLKVHPYTLRTDRLPPQVINFDHLLRILFLDANVDGIFTDFPDLAIDFLRNHVAQPKDRATYDYATTWLDQHLRMNQIQTIGSHNSFKEAIAPSLMQILRQLDPNTADSLDYEHISLTKQLDLGLRQLELDLFYDPEGGRYANPYGIMAAKEMNLPLDPPYDPKGKMKNPGFKVLHVQDIDFRSNCMTFKEALEEVHQWSKTHPRHTPILITINTKEDVIDQPNFVQPLPFDRQAFDHLDQEILSVFGISELIVPDYVRGNYKTLETAITADQWPTLKASRGKIFFALDANQEKIDIYKDSHPSLQGRILFVDAKEGQPEAAFRIINDPLENRQYIQDLVLKGYLVRTRADADTKEARTGDTTRLEAALVSGAHFISTDYYLPENKFGTGYRVQLPTQTPVRFNPNFFLDNLSSSLLEQPPK